MFRSDYMCLRIGKWFVKSYYHLIWINNILLIQLWSASVRKIYSFLGRKHTSTLSASSIGLKSPKRRFRRIRWKRTGSSISEGKIYCRFNGRARIFNGNTWSLCWNISWLSFVETTHWFALLLVSMTFVLHGGNVVYHFFQSYALS